MSVIRRLASALALYGLPLLLVLSAVGWFGLRFARGVDPPVVTTTSTAMKPAVRPGDLVFLVDVDPDELAVGDAIAFRDESGDILMRRVLSRDVRGATVTYEVLGDNRRDDEPVLTTDARVIGRIGRRLPLLGYALVVFRSTAGQVLLAAVCLFGFAGAFRARFHHRDAPDDESLPAEPQALTYGGGDRATPPTTSNEETVMSITPAELRHVRFAQVRRGYDTEAVDRALESVADSIEELLHERHELVERVRRLESEIERYHEVEGTLSQTLTLAERAAEELNAEAQAEADRILTEARTQLAAAQQAAARTSEAPAPTPPTSAMPDPAFIELLGETRAIRSLLQALLTAAPQGEGGSPFSPRADQPKSGR